MATLQQQEALHREGRLILALQAYKQGQTNSLNAAAVLYNVSETTARQRITSIQPKRGSYALNCLLTPI